MSLTERCARVGQEVMSEFESFSESLHELERRGHSHADRYEEASPAVRQEVDKQLDNIRSSYSSLHATAQQIKVSRGTAPLLWAVVFQNLTLRKMLVPWRRFRFYRNKLYI